jgi:hypothetical protein
VLKQIWRFGRRRTLYTGTKLLSKPANGNEKGIDYPPGQSMYYRHIARQQQYLFRLIIAMVLGCATNQKASETRYRENEAPTVYGRIRLRSLSRRYSWSEEFGGVA